MGIVLRQSAKNTAVTYFGFTIGAVNTLFLLTSFLGKTDIGIMYFILNAANILMPVMAFGVHSTLIRFFSRYKDEREREEFMTFMLLMPLLVIVPVSLLIVLGYDMIHDFIIRQNPEAAPFVMLIPVIGIFMAYFEIFYAWAKVHMQSVIGNLISEVLVRVMTMGLLFGIYLGWLSKTTFLYCLVLTYGMQFLAMFVYALYVKRPVLRLKLPENVKEIFRYSSFIILSGGIAVGLLYIDQFIMGLYGLNAGNAVYGVAIFIATVISVPSRAMLQIIYPITAKLMSEEKYDELNKLYKRSAITLQYLGGLIMLGIFLNLKQLFVMIPGHFESGTIAVFLIGLSKFYDVILGNNNAIILNTKYYKSVLLFGLLLVVLIVVLNCIFIPLYGVNGSALATLLSVGIYNTVKLVFVVRKIKLYPFTAGTFKSFAIIILVFLAFYFWEFPFHPLLNIVLKSGLITLVYICLNFMFSVSEDVDSLLTGFARKLRKKA